VLRSGARPGTLHFRAGYSIMCGRISISTPPSHLKDEFQEVQRQDVLDDLDTPRYNIGPTFKLPAIRSAEGNDEWALLRWGLIPPWAKDEKIGYRTINARAETVAEKPAFRSAYRHRRCLLPVTGFYEWQKTPGGKQPHHIHLKDEELFTLAGLWEEWTSPEGEIVESCTVLTTDANQMLSALHDRMPVIVDRPEHEVWLHGSTDEARHVLRPFDADRMVAHPVSTYVSNVRNQGPECIEPLTGLPSPRT
jgi:putative SOS response-associated peptidase YedK